MVNKIIGSLLLCMLAALSLEAMEVENKPSIGKEQKQKLKVKYKDILTQQDQTTLKVFIDKICKGTCDGEFRKQKIGELKFPKYGESPGENFLRLPKLLAAFGYFQTVYEEKIGTEITGDQYNNGELFFVQKIYTEVNDLFESGDSLDLSGESNEIENSINYIHEILRPKLKNLPVSDPRITSAVSLLNDLKSISSTDTLGNTESKGKVEGVAHVNTNNKKHGSGDDNEGNLPRREDTEKMLPDMKYALTEDNKAKIKDLKEAIVKEDQSLIDQKLEELESSFQDCEESMQFGKWLSSLKYYHEECGMEKHTMCYARCQNFFVERMNAICIDSPPESEWKDIEYFLHQIRNEIYPLGLMSKSIGTIMKIEEFLMNLPTNINDCTHTEDRKLDKDNAGFRDQKEKSFSFKQWFLHHRFKVGSVGVLGIVGIFGILFLVKKVMYQ